MHRRAEELLWLPLGETKPSPLFTGMPQTAAASHANRISAVRRRQREGPRGGADNPSVHRANS